MKMDAKSLPSLSSMIRYSILLLCAIGILLVGIINGSEFVYLVKEEKRRQKENNENIEKKQTHLVMITAAAITKLALTNDMVDNEQLIRRRSDVPKEIQTTMMMMDDDHEPRIITFDRFPSNNLNVFQVEHDLDELDDDYADDDEYYQELEFHRYSAQSQRPFLKNSKFPETTSMNMPAKTTTVAPSPAKKPNQSTGGQTDKLQQQQLRQQLQKLQKYFHSNRNLNENTFNNCKMKKNLHNHHCPTQMTMMMMMMKEDDKDSLVGTSASDDEYDDDEEEEVEDQNGIGRKNQKLAIPKTSIKSESSATSIMTAGQANTRQIIEKSSSLRSCCAKHHDLNNGKISPKCSNYSDKLLNHDGSRESPGAEESLPKSFANNVNNTGTVGCCYCSSDLIDSDHFYYTTDSTNSSNDNLTFSPLPPDFKSANIDDIKDEDNFCDSKTMISTTSANVWLSTAKMKNDHHQPYKNEINDKKPHYQCPLSSTIVSIRDAVSHLTRLDDFNVVKLSQGFFSQVFKVTHLPTGKIMVLKMNKNPGNRGNALKEIELLNKLNHPNIVAYMGTVVHEGALHPLLEYINGGTLEQLIQKYYPQQQHKNVDHSVKDLIRNQQQHQSNHSGSASMFSSPKVHRLKNVDQTFLKLMQDVCQGMAYLHSKGYLHRDLASKNIFIRKQMMDEDLQERKQQKQMNDKTLSVINGDHRRPLSTSLSSDTGDDIIYDDHRLEAVIGDFGFATTEPSTPEHKLSIVGSPYWLAPECLNNKWYNHKCDIFSFGIICCELNWRTPSDPDFLPRCDNYAVDFAKLAQSRKDSRLGRIAMLACQLEPKMRPEFHELLKLFNSNDDRDENERPFSLVHHHYSSSTPVSSITKSSQLLLADNDNYQANTRLMKFPKATFKRFNSLDPGLLLNNNGNKDNYQNNDDLEENVEHSYPDYDVFEQHLQRRRHSALIDCHNLSPLSCKMDMDHHHNSRS